MAEPKKTIAVVLYPGVTPLDVGGPMQVLANLAPGFEMVTVAERCERLPTDTPLQLIAARSFEEVRHPYLLFVPGSSLPPGEVTGSEALRAYVRSAGVVAEQVVAVGTGALILAAAGLLEGSRATTHWAHRADLERLGAHYEQLPSVEEGKYITGAGVSAGIDIALRLVRRFKDQRTAEQVQVAIEYDPAPPFGGIDWGLASGGDGTASWPRRPVVSPVETDRKTIAAVLYDGLTPLDLLGPLQVLSAMSAFAPEYETVVVSERVAPMTGDSGLTMLANRSFAEVPHPFALLVPGGSIATIRSMSNPVLRRYLQSAAPTAQVIASVCTGALILAANGLIPGGVGTTHWGYYGVLESLGVRYTRKRWVEDGKVIMSAGVSAGIDMALQLAANLTDRETARKVQLSLQYEPAPPFGCIEWDHLSLLLRAVRTGWRAAAPFVTLRPKQLLRAGR